MTIHSIHAPRNAAQDDFVRRPNGDAASLQREEHRLCALGVSERLSRFTARLKANAGWLKHFLHGDR